MRRCADAQVRRCADAHVAAGAHRRELPIAVRPGGSARARVLVAARIGRRIDDAEAGQHARTPVSAADARVCESAALAGGRADAREVRADRIRPQVEGAKKPPADSFGGGLKHDTPLLR